MGQCGDGWLGVGLGGSVGGWVAQCGVEWLSVGMGGSMCE